MLSVLLLVSVLTQTLLPLVCSDLMSFSFFTARHTIKNYVFISVMSIVLLHTPAGID